MTRRGAGAGRATVGAAASRGDVVEVLRVVEVPTIPMVRARADVVVAGLDHAGRLGGALLHRHEAEWVAGTPDEDGDVAGPRAVWLRTRLGGLAEPEAVVVRDLVAGLGLDLLRARDLQGHLAPSCTPTGELGLAHARRLGHGLAGRHRSWQRFTSELCRRRSVTLFGRVTSRHLVEDLVGVALAIEQVRLVADDLVDDLLLRCGRPVPVVEAQVSSSHLALPRGLDDPGPLVRALVEGVVRLLPDSHQDRYHGEWNAELDDLPFGSRLPYAVRLAASARHLRRALRLDLSDPSDRREPWGRR